MARTVYSTPFIQYSSTSPNLTYEVEEGYTAVCRYGAVTQDIGGYDYSWYVYDAAGAGHITFDAGSGVAVFEVAQWSGRVVVPGGGFIALFLSSVGDAPSAYLGGYLLQNAAPT